MASNKKSGKVSRVTSDTPVTPGDGGILIPASKLRMAPADNPRFDTPLQTPAEAAADYLSSPDCKALFASFDRSNGPITPLLVMPSKNGLYTVIDGWTRLQWAKSKKKRDVKLRCTVLSEIKSTNTRAILNVARRSYNPLVEASLFRRAVAEHKGNVSQAARALGVTRPTMQNRLRLLKLPVKMQLLISQGAVNQTAGETLFNNLSGGGDFLKREERSGKLSKEELAKAKRFERGMEFIVNRINKEREKDKTYSAKNTAITAMWGEFVRDDVDGRVKKARKKVIKKGEVRTDMHAIDDAVMNSVNTDGVTDAMTTCGAEIASNLLLLQGKCPERVAVNLRIANKTAEDTLLALAYTQGWSCPAILVRHAINEETGDPLYSEESIKTMNEDVVRDYVLSGFLQNMRDNENLVLRATSPLHNREEWQKFYRRQLSIVDLIGELREHLTNMTEEKREAVLGKLTSKAKPEKDEYADEDDDVDMDRDYTESDELDDIPV